jgi:hypothetical protein
MPPRVMGGALHCRPQGGKLEHVRSKVRGRNGADERRFHVRLSDLERQRGGAIRYLGTLSDSAGDTSYELAISGPARLIDKAPADSDFEHGSNPQQPRRNWATRTRKFWYRHAGENRRPREHETFAALARKPPPATNAENSIVVSVRRTEGEGTWWGFWWPALGLSAGSSIFFLLPPICNCSAFVMPASGDPNLFLTANGPATPLLAASTAGPGAFDSVAFGPAHCWPWTEFVPWFRLVAVTTTVFSFGMTGFGVLP